jgi:hypothetical protein
MSGGFAFQGLAVVPSPHAREVRIEFRVERMPIKKRRRGWRVVRHQIDRPGCYRAGNILFIHPELLESMKRSVGA